MKILKRSLPVFVLLTLLFCAFPSFGAAHTYEPYYITAYDVEIHVAEDNVLRVTENIDVHFNEARHGIYRYIPLRNQVERADGSTAVTRAKVNAIHCSDSYSKSTENSQLVLQIGDEDTTLTGDHHYTISYNYALGQDVVNGSDELYYNIIGSGWDTYIDNVTFRIAMPKDFNADLLGFSAGSYGFEGTSSIEYYVNGLEITGRLTRELGPYEAFTVRLELPDGYFYFDTAAHIAKLCAMVCIPIICLLIVALIWRRFGKDKKVVKIVEFYPPEGMSSTDVAYWYKGALSNEDMVPLLIELANEGYIAINESKSSEYYDGADYVIERRKTYNGPDSNKKIFFDGLFESGKSRITNEDLENVFYKHLNQIAANYNTMSNRRKVFSNTSLIMRVVCLALVAASLAADILIFNRTFGAGERYAAFIAGIVILAAAFILSFFVRKRTDQGHQILQKIEGFKLFLETAEKDRLEKLVFDDPKYFYNILPYAYVLGVSDAWVKKFEDIAVEPPDWYYGSGTFHTYMMWHFMSSTMHSAAQAMTSAPQTSSGGGGGFAGGGSGGGGGGSW